ncbi:glycosyltransferase family 2 protein [Winogradskyella poriferorum]|uniref:glycosyltransferase family 2 protein n=1 Tax=Winogradskyella poriferorum TaxID=307627 RepID=UPI003D64B957
MQPLISIIIPTYNREKLLIETLDSILLQTYENWECIIIDDGSTDNSETIITTYTDNDSRFLFYNRPDYKPKGANACRNFGYEMSKGQFINWFDSDDIMHPKFLEIRITRLIEDKNLDFCACLGRKFVKGIEIDPLTIRPPIMKSDNYLEDYLLNGLFFYTPAPLWRRRFLSGKKLFDESMHRGQESDFHLRLLAYNPKYLYLEDALFYIRVGQESITTTYQKSLLAQKSIFNYFNTAFKVISEQGNAKGLILKRYIFYRQCVNYYNVSLLSKGFKGRLRSLMDYTVNIFTYSFNSKLNFGIILKLLLGMLILLFFNRGYNLFYYPQYDYRTYK